MCLTLEKKIKKQYVLTETIMTFCLLLYVFCFIPKRLICSIKYTLCTEYSSLLEFITRHVLIYLLERLLTQRASLTIYVEEKCPTNSLERIIVVVTKKGDKTPLFF